MKYKNKFIALIFVSFVIVGGLAVSVSAQRSGTVIVQPSSQSRLIVRRSHYRSRFFRTHYRGFSRFYDPFWDSPYLRFQEQKFALQRELAGNRRELEEHLAKYRADGTITAKEQEELDDDYEDVREAKQKLERFTRDY